MHNRPPQTDYSPATRRSADATLEMLDDALSRLERRIGIGAPPAAQPRPRNDDIAAIRARQEALARRPAPRAYAPATPTQQAYAPAPQAYAPAAPAQQASPSLHDEIARMREELNREMSSTVTRQFAAIREELKGLLGQGGAVSPADLSDGFNRLTRELGLVASRVENADTGSLRAEVEELKSHVAALAREDTLRDMAERWTVIEREIGTLPQTLGSREDLMAIAGRISDINVALHGLAETQSTVAMEEQMRALAEAVESIAAQNHGVSPEYLSAIEGRLDEISHAVAAVSVSPRPLEFDTTPFERIEARLASLARQVEENVGGRDTVAVEHRLVEIAERLAALHDSVASSAPADAFDSVAERLEQLASRIETAGQAAPSATDHMLDRLNARFEEIAGRIDSGRASAEEAGERMLRSLDARMEELARRIEDNEREAVHLPTFDHMERRIEEIAEMLTAGDAFGAPQPYQPDTRALESLEAQIAALGEKLSGATPAVSDAALADLAPRLAAIADQMAGGRQDMIAAAREAAEEIIGRYSGETSDEERGMLSQLAGDLQGLEDLARNSDERNTRTFEAIHDTLVKVADRIAALESSLRETRLPAAAEVPAETARRPAPVAASQMAFVEDAPSVDIAAGQPEIEEPWTERERAPRQPVPPREAAALAARAAASGADMDAGPAGRLVKASAPKKEAKSILGGLRNALSRGAAGSSAATAAPAAAEPPLFGGEGAETAGTPDLADEPIEPGSGAPDLAEIMKRVRAERGGAPAAQGQGVEDDAGKSDFIAAARRAARAAAAEASVLDSARSDGSKSKKRGGGAAFSPKSRPLLVGAGAILLAILAYPLARGYLPGSDHSGGVAQLQDATPETAPGDTVAPADPIVNDPAADAVAAPSPMRVIDKAAPSPTDMANTADMATAPEQTADNAPAMEPSLPAGAPADMASAATDSGVAAISMHDIPDQIGPVALREAAVKGDPKAMFVIGDRLMGKNPGAAGSDMKAAVHWYEMAADLGYAPAQYRLGNAYEKGLGVTRDVDTAKTWYQLAAEQGNASAMHNLAVLYATAVDGKSDMDSAARWFLEAADLGVKDSQVNLGILSARGEGVPQDLAESYKWLSLAAEAGDTDAAAKRDEVAKFMRPDQLEIAKGAVKLWKARPLDVAANTVDVPDGWQVGDSMTASAPAAPSSQVDLKKAVRNIQAILNNAGYDAGPADGVMGARTRQAITDFQNDNGMVPTGEVDKALVDKLLEVNRNS